MSLYSVHCCCADSYDSVFHRTILSQFALNLCKGNHELRQALKGLKIESFIGAIYLPKGERYRWVSFTEPTGKIMWGVGGSGLTLRPFTSAVQAI